jgi:hypothetical protein
MHIRTRKLIGTFALLVLVTLWALLAMAVAQVTLTSTSGIVAGLYHVVAGLGWGAAGHAAGALDVAADRDRSRGCR